MTSDLPFTRSIAGANPVMFFFLAAMVITSIGASPKTSVTDCVIFSFKAGMSSGNRLSHLVIIKTTGIW